jgi:multidrug resistance efflux pump
MDPEEMQARLEAAEETIKWAGKTILRLRTELAACRAQYEICFDERKKAEKALFELEIQHAEE